MAKKKGGKYYQENGTTRVGDFFRGLKESGKKVGPELIDLAVNQIPGVGILKKLVPKIENDPDLSELDKETALSLLDKDIKELEVLQAAIQASADIEKLSVQSEDKFVRRARPFRIYAGTAVILFGLIVWPILFDGAIMPFNEYILFLILGDSASYTVARTVEKTTGKNISIGSVVGKLMNKKS